MEVIAYYLPQYHPTKHNDEWWGKGFTEWTNVAKAKPLFKGHYQPKIPADLGFYDLRMPEIREEQANLAKLAGVTAFCYYHYWFGNGHQELDLPFREVVKSKKPDFPFCLCWANESWARKFWNKDGSLLKQDVLAEQKYLGEEDDILHFNHLLPAFKDKRYLKIDDKLVFVIYQPLLFEEVSRFMSLWNKLAKEQGLNGFYFIGYTYNVAKEKNKIFDLGFNAIDSCRLNRNRIKGMMWFFRKSFSVLFNTPRRVAYSKVITELDGEEEKDENVFPTLIPNWDHTPRSGTKGDLFTNCTPSLFEKHVRNVMNRIKNKPDNRKIIFLKSWNEWGEGNYMEPDLKFGKGFILALKTVLEEYQCYLS